MKHFPSFCHHFFQKIFCSNFLNHIIYLYNNISFFLQTNNIWSHLFSEFFQLLFNIYPSFAYLVYVSNPPLNSYLLHPNSIHWFATPFPPLSLYLTLPLPHSPSQCTIFLSLSPSHSHYLSLPISHSLSAQVTLAMLFTSR